VPGVSNKRQPAGYVAPPGCPGATPRRQPRRDDPGSLAAEPTSPPVPSPPGAAERPALTAEGPRWRILGECRGKRFTLARVEAEVDGRRITRDVLLHPGAVAVLAVDSGRVLLERQYRVPVGGWIYEIPAGTREPGESPEETARRELVEETGYEPLELTELFRFYPSPGVSTEEIHVFLAERLRYVGARPEPDEAIETLWVGLDEALEMVRDGRIRDGKTIAALLYYRLLRGG